jgi:hypothetical protein
MKITVALKFIEDKDKGIKINIYDRNTYEGTHIAAPSGNKWYNISDSIIHIYPKQISDGTITKDDQLPYVFAHELGHAFGLRDAYGNINIDENGIIVNTINDGFGIYTDYTDQNLEFSYIDMEAYGTFAAGEIMANNGLPCSNDIEMMLQAFCENEMQYFYITEQRAEEGLSLSKAIKNPIIIYEKKGATRSDDTYLIFDRKSNEYTENATLAEMREFVEDNIHN